jgi:hypothetical protein
MRDKVEAAEAAWREAQRATECARQEVKRVRAAAVIAVRPDLVEFDLNFGAWSCADSPTGKCVYDLRGKDHCIFCEMPNERK